MQRLQIAFPKTIAKLCGLHGPGGDSDCGTSSGSNSVDFAKRAGSPRCDSRNLAIAVASRCAMQTVRCPET